jgi:hypothetical protein
MDQWSYLMLGVIIWFFNDLQFWFFESLEIKKKFKFSFFNTLLFKKKS